MIHSSSLHSVSSGREREYLEGWQRARAELSNFQKRVVGQREEEKQMVKREIARSLVLLLDSMDALVQHMPPALKDDAWGKGVVHVARQFDQVMKEYGVSVIGEESGPFNPDFHEAVEEVKKSGVKSGTVLEVLQRGYKVDDSVVRPAKVKVAK